MFGSLTSNFTIHFRHKSAIIDVHLCSGVYLPLYVAPERGPACLAMSRMMDNTSELAGDRYPLCGAMFLPKVPSNVQTNMRYPRE